MYLLKKLNEINVTFTNSNCLTKLITWIKFKKVFVRNIDIYIKSINHFVLACLHLYIFCYFEKETESFNNKKKRSLRYPQHLLNSISTINDFVFYWNRLILSPSETTETTRRLCLHLRNGTYERWWLLDLMLFLFLLLTS